MVLIWSYVVVLVEELWLQGGGQEEERGDEGWDRMRVVLVCFLFIFVIGILVLYVL